jgi:3-hydroxyacyl-[acyl-carrier-protein] dehydratase
MKTLMTFQDITRCLPHRYPFLLIDKVIELVPGESIVAIKNVTINEPFFIGHFPTQPVMPGVLILEALAQASGILAHESVPEEERNKDYLYLFAGVENTRFKRMVEPGDQLRLTARLQRQKRGIWKFSGEATVDGELACSTEIITALKENKS